MQTILIVGGKSSHSDKYRRGQPEEKPEIENVRDDGEKSKANFPAQSKAAIIPRAFGLRNQQERGFWLLAFSFKRNAIKFDVTSRIDK